MPLYHCNKCHHEFEGYSDSNPKCDWCGGESYIIEEKTPLERMCEGDTIKKLLGELKKINRRTCKGET